MVITAPLKAQISPSNFEYPYNHLPWYTIEGEHFMIHYQDGSEKTAAAASLIAQKIYEPITDLYDYEPERKVSIVLRDREDYSNGAAYFFDDKIDIWIPPLDTPLRGTHQWLRNVITHEFTHIVQMGASMRRTPTVQAIYFQWLSYEDVRRPDVLYGSPNGIVIHPFSTVSIPAWFSEGTAQYMRENIFYDYWDSHRDMILRMNILEDNALDFVEMGNFSSKTSIEREMVYNQGFDFVRYLAERFGENVIPEIASKSAEGKNDLSSVIKEVTGFSGRELYNDWIQNRKAIYSKMINSAEADEATRIESEGFFNFYPQFNSHKESFAYLTNRGRDFATTQLIVETADSSIIIDDLIKPTILNRDQDPSNSFHSYSDVAIDYVGNRFSFSPDGTLIVYNKPDKNRYGERYNDIFIFDIETEKSKKVTSDERLQDPAWHPKTDSIVAVELLNGTQNLVLIDLETNEKKQLTQFQNGETVFTPVWSSEADKIYFSSADINTRNIYQLDLDSGTITAPFQNDWIDFRDPWVDPANDYLYFSSNEDGIFNIYRQELKSGSIQQITNVRGGAFMPFATSDSLYFSEYRSTGYKITAIPLPDFEETHQPNDMTELPQNRIISSLPAESSYEMVQGFSEIHDSLKTEDTTQEITFQSSNENDDTYFWRPYSQNTTGLSVTPVIRFDNYSKRKGNNSRLIKDGQFQDVGKNLIRDFKAGAYFSSRDVTERLSIFAGAMFGWGSVEAESLSDFFSPNRLNNLDRDLFFIVDHRGIPFIKRSWSPTISIELYNLKRNVRDGVSIEEFPCTSCLPVQKSVDVRYNVWEASLYLRSKLNRWSLLELGATYSPYSVATDGFFSEEFKELIPGSTTEYFKGASNSISYITDTTIPSRHSDIAPEGFRSSTTLQIENGRLLQEFEIEDGSLSPVYAKTTNYSLELANQLGGAFIGNTNGLITSRIFTYFNRPNDYFYLDYAGGLSGMRSYPYFALGGQRTAWARFSLLSPLKRDINKQIGAYSFDKIYSHLFFEVGNGWGGPLNIGNTLKTGIGAEVRIALDAYYLYPLKLFVNATYGFNQFNVTLPSQFITTSSTNSISYGKELLFYFGLTFDFNQL